MEQEKTIDQVMSEVPQQAWRYRWCTAGEKPMPEGLSDSDKRMWGACACLGCCNRFVRAAGYTKQDWQEWFNNNRVKVEDVDLSYGDGFAGRHYTMQVFGSSYKLMDGVGSEEEEQQARVKATNLLKRFGFEGDLSSVRFKWDGLM